MWGTFVPGVFGEVGEITDEFGSFSFISFAMLLGYIAFKVSRRFQLYPQDRAELFLSIFVDEFHLEQHIGVGVAFQNISQQ